MHPNTQPSQPMLERDPSCNVRVCYVQWSDLPLECPLPDTSLWNAHPRIYLPIHETGRQLCGYCGTMYILQPPVANEPSPDFANAEIEKCYRRALQHATDGQDQLPDKAPAISDSSKA